MGTFRKKKVQASLWVKATQQTRFGFDSGLVGLRFVQLLFVAKKIPRTTSRNRKGRSVCRGRCGQCCRALAGVGLFDCIALQCVQVLFGAAERGDSRWVYTIWSLSCVSCTASLLSSSTQSGLHFRFCLRVDIHMHHRKWQLQDGVS